ncbi:MAG: hypothetical protein O6837_02390, partial [Deltaproteobacteria bacterium]|nr:hypothetical protein [Deltaproteobacteria bacterium]
MAGNKWFWAVISLVILVAGPGFMGGYSEAASGWTKPTAITRGIKVSYVQFTPDGRLLFVGNDSVMLSNPDGTGSITLIKYPGVKRAIISPDMKKIVFDNGFDIFVANRDGSDVTSIANDPAILEGGSWFSPDGKRLVYFTIDDKNRVYGIWTMDPDGKNRINVASSKGAQIFRHPRWSPDGSRISFFTVRKGVMSISVMNLDGSARVALTSSSESPSRQASWSPDSKRLVYSRRSKSFNLWVMDARGANKMQITDLSGNDAKPVWSLDGTKIAF